MSKSVQKAVDFISGRLSNGYWKTGERLPPASQLAKSIHVGIHAMLKALQIVKSQQKIVVEKRMGIFAGNTIPGREIDTSNYGKKWQRLAAQIEADLVEQEPGEPHRFSAKEISLRYHASMFICRKALKSLLEKKRLENSGKGYRVPVPKKNTAFASILFISQVYGHPDTPQGNHLSIFNQRIYDFLTAASRLCEKNSIQFSKLGVNFSIPQSRELLLDAINNQSHIGFVIYIPGHIDTSLKHHFILPFIGTQKPVAFVLDSGEMVLPDAFSRRHAARVFYPSDKKAGYRAGKFLLEKGYSTKNIAYIAEGYTGKSWSQQRFAGLCEALYNKHTGDAPTLFCQDQMLPDLAMHAILADRRRITESIAALSTDSEIGRILLTYQQNAAATQFDSSRRYLNLFPLFKQIIALQTYTVWVCENDDLAFAADFFFYQHATNKQITLIGFDNSSLSRFKLITTYDFDFGSIAQRAMAFIISPDNPLFSHQREIACEGHVVEW